jgi:hypothetical protein
MDVTLSWVKGHHNGEKLIQHSLNDEAHSVAYNFITQDQGNYNPSSTVIDPPTAEISILFDHSTLISKVSSFLREQLTATPLQATKATICKAENWTSEVFSKWTVFHIIIP